MNKRLFVRVAWAAICAGTVVLRMNVSATDGIAVYSKDGSGALQYYGPQDGELWRSIIENDQVTSQEKIFDGPCTRPVICPNGMTVAFIKNSGGATISTISIDGGEVTELTDCSPDGCIDFPSNDWIYFTLGSDFDGSSKILKRVSASGTVEEVVTFKWRVAQIQISNDLTKAAIRTSDANGIYAATILAYDMPGDGSGASAHDVGGGSTWSCASGLFCDGQHVMDGHQDPHEAMDIRNWDGSLATTYANKDACAWPPNSDKWKPTTWNHSIFHSGASTNNPRWLQIAIGGPRDYAGDGVLLINPFDHQCIAPTAGLTGRFSHGDFWTGSPVKATRDRGPVPNVTAGSFTIKREGRGVYVRAQGTHKVELLTVSGGLVRTYRGTGAATYLLPAHGIASGAYVLRVTTPTERRAVRIALR